MNIIGEKILLRAVEHSDSSMLLNIINDADTEYMLGGWSFPISSSEQDEWLRNIRGETNTLRCTIENHGTAVGIVMLTDIDYKNGNAEVHIKLALDETCGKGYGTDAILTIVKYAFNELRLKCIYANVSQHNQASLKLFSKCGFIEEGIQRCRLYKRGHYIDVISLSIINGCI